MKRSNTMKKTIMLLTASLGLAAAPGAWAAVIFDTTTSASSLSDLGLQLCVTH